jgi:hypothetical protein
VTWPAPCRGPAAVPEGRAARCSGGDELGEAAIGGNLQL